MAKTKFDAQINIIDKIIEIVPDLKERREQIIRQLLRPQLHKTGEYVVERFIIDNLICYKDNKIKALIDEKLELLGTWIFDKHTGENNYFLFNDDINYEIQMPILDT